MERDLADGPQQSVDRILAPHQQDEAVRANFEAMARTIGDAAVASGNSNRLKAWWLYRMLFSPDRLGERLVLLWHNHFATSNRKVRDLALLREQNELMRTHARAPFGELLRAVVKHPAMLVWLDADANRKGHPNENLARETMELFTLGVGHYTEEDVQAAARALTGWAVVGGRFGFRESRHDPEDKVFLGRQGPLNGDQLLDALLANPAVADRVADRICNLFFGESAVSDADRQELADGLRANHLDIGWAVEMVLRSQLFFADSNLCNRVTGPVEWCVGAVRALECTDPPPSTLLMAEWTTRMGQDLFYPPNVGGWTEGRAWLHSRGLVARANFAAALVDGRVWHPPQPCDLQQIVHRHRPTDDLAESVTWFAELLLGDVDNNLVREIVGSTNHEIRDQRLSAAVTLLLARPEAQLS
jgi:uncharacterized protein (DUF1800 family)